MPNVLLTQQCVRSCPYCFARRHMSESAPDDIISWEDLIYVADFLWAGGERRFPILGGEPTLHPDFLDMVIYVLERGFDVTVFTSGIMADEKLALAAHELLNVPPQRLSFVCNLNDPEKTRTPPAELEAVKRFLRHFGERTVPGFNIYRPDFDLHFLFELINQYGMNRSIRLGFAHPIVGTKNKHIAVADIGEIVARLYSYREKLERYRIRPGLDCGFPMCGFDDEQLGWLYRTTGGRYDFGCGPVLDIGPDLTVWSCFPLSSFHKRSLFEFDSLKALHEYYADLHRKVRVEVSGLYPECDGCVARDEKRCHAGCLAHAIQAFQNEERLRMPEMYL